MNWTDRLYALVAENRALVVVPDGEGCVLRLVPIQDWLRGEGKDLRDLKDVKDKEEGGPGMPPLLDT